MGIASGMEWIVFLLPDGREMKTLVKEHKSDKRLVKMVIDAPRDVKVSRRANLRTENKK